MSAKGSLRLAPKTTPVAVEDVWRRAAERLRVGLGEDVFNSWFGGLRLEEFVSGRARFSVSTRFLKSWIEAHYQEKLFSALAAELEGVLAVEIHVRSRPPSPLRLADAQSATACDAPPPGPG